MRLALRLGAYFGTLLAGLLCAALWAAFESGAAVQRRDLDARLLAALETLSNCVSTPGSDPERACLPGVHTLVSMTDSQAFMKALLVDEDLRVLVHSDFLRGDVSARGMIANDPYVATVANRRDPFFIQAQSATGQTITVYASPARAAATDSRAGSERVGTWIAVFRSESLDRAVRGAHDALRWRLVQMGALGTGVGLLFSVGLAVYLVRPLNALMAASRQVASGDFSGRVPEDRGDELGRLAGEFNQMAARLGQLDEMKETFMAQITHDLRAPLSSIVGYTELVVKGYKGPVSPDQAAALETVIKCGRSLAELVNNILDVTQLEAKRMPLNPEPVELAGAVESVLNVLQVRAQEYGVNLDTYLLPELAEVYADPQALARVLTNLVNNALKFTPSGGQVTVKAYRGARNEAVLAVSDTGIGIPKERLPTIFAKFSQVPETKNKVRPVHGTGLGLTICKQLVEGMGGRIWVESEYQKGTTFCFTLPERGAQPSPSLATP
ncbi:MAG: HAMP domain-containing histidine kinase [Elusimicrobia bacterium]|nr:HAMP domain-containing histidine kinase [Elusimicrobiota bacterium]